MFYELENNDIKIVVSDLGATLVKFIDKNTGKDIVLGFDDEQSYLDTKCYLGASVGRNANRIGNAEFVLNDVTYKLSVNDNMNQLHGGVDNFAFKTWKLKEKNDNSITFTYFSKDGEEGFPGNLHVDVTYMIENNNLLWIYSGLSDQDTILNMTNHSYFNLGDENIFNHKLKVFTGKYSPTDEYALTLDKTVDVKGTPYDFTVYTQLSDNLSKLENGIDNNYVFEKMGEKHMASLRYKDLELNVYSDMPDMHLYTSSNLIPCQGKYGVSYDKYKAVCLECQYYPNGINYGSYIKPIIKKGEQVTHYIKYVVSHND